ncbi:gluconate 2-dehydrogenase subunit 3 family protein [Paraburkholderia sp. DHOC27]|uniref:gluconate 2-dehydrogenase subunit 3 family protein n=1 Tax=Paraburkholderia sp. DHOC27 TaxID=2303330 RepID=UPI000E3D2D54|nr:gluconate 2-dehydrogenase subunit 3 family protein [Paraburkholderia sp. DHOC27]RFU49371.1 hypothetical protein D0B32_06120 [Paraburkholderia sp. DHOC27]
MQADPLDHTHVLNFTAKYLSRGSTSSGFSEAWRFPIIESTRLTDVTAAQHALNQVTFVWRAADRDDERHVTVVGNFDNLWDSTLLEPVMFDKRRTFYRAATVRVPSGRSYLYKFMVDGQPVLDPINPQRVLLDTGAQWSRFFTNYCAVPVSLEGWEISILARLTNEILPFTEGAAQKFMDNYYYNADNATRQSAYRLEQPVGAVNFIDNILAREEHHRLVDYKICLAQIDAVLRKRYPSLAPSQVGSDGYQQLYAQMSAGIVPDWDTSAYQNPRFFLQLLRRHTFCGAFSHPKYGGNVGGAGWAYLEDTFRDQAKPDGTRGENCFHWREAIERPLGDNLEYFG